MRLIIRYAKGFYMSLGMFCAIPVFYRPWDDSCVNLILPCFPLIGVLLGLIWWGAAEILVACGIHIMLASAALTTVPFLLTGFLHLDGYMDTSDAVLSRRPLEDKLRILKDPHNGAFSVIMLTVLFTLQFGAVYAAVDLGKKLMPLVLITVISRCCSSLSLFSLNVMSQSSYANMFKQNVLVSHKFFVSVLTILTIAASYPLSGVPGLSAATFTILGFIGAMTYSYKELKGVSGDLVGFSLVIGELCGLIALAVT